MKPERPSLRQPLVLIAAWLWVIGILAAYIAGFSDVIRLLLGSILGNTG